MARSAAAARAPRARTTHGRPARATPKKPPRRASGRAERNAQAIRKSATAQKARKAAPARKPARQAAAPRGRGPAVAAAQAGAGTVALPLPLRVIRAPFTRSLRSRGSGVLDTLLRGRGWIALVGVLLVGIVFFNVDLLKLNRDIAATAQKASGVERENARLRLELAKLDSSERVQTTAAAHGLLLPAPGDVRYLRANPFVDATRAAKLIEAPDSSVAAPEPTPQATTPAPTAPQQAATPQATTTPQTTTTPQATVQPQAAPAAPVQQQTQPQAQAQPGTTTAAPTG